MKTLIVERATNMIRMLSLNDMSESLSILTEEKLS